MLGYKRSVRVAALIQEEISKIVQDLKEPELGFVTVTGVKLTDDLKTARIFYSVIGSEEEKKITGKILEEKTPSIRHQLAIRINLKFTPVVVFEYDITPEKASRVFELLDKIKKEEEQ